MQQIQILLAIIHVINQLLFMDLIDIRLLFCFHKLKRDLQIHPVRLSLSIKHF